MHVIHLLLSLNLNMFMKSSHWQFGIYHRCVQTAHCYWKYWKRAVPFPHNQLQGNTYCCLQANTWYCLLPSVETWPISFKIALIKTRSYNTRAKVFPKYLPGMGMAIRQHCDQNNSTTYQQVQTFLHLVLLW